MAKGWLLANTTDPDIYGGQLAGRGGMDVSIDASGHLRTLTGRERIRHALLKGILTVREDGYGSAAAGLVGEKAAAALPELVAASIQNFVEEYRDSQPDLPDEETIESVNTLQILPDQDSATVLRMVLVLNMVDGQSIEIEHRF